MREYFFEKFGIHYRIGGASDATQWVVLIHGLSGSSSAWKHCEKHFETKYRVLSFDLRGHGYSRRPTDMREYSMRHMAFDVIELLNLLNIKKPILIGHSLGTLVLFELLDMQPMLPYAVIFLSPEYDMLRRVFSRFGRVLLWPVRILQHLPIKHPVGRHVEYAPRFVGTGDWNIFRILADIRATGVRAFLYATYHAMFIHKPQVPATVTCPVLLVHGARDTIFPIENTHELATLFPHATVAILDRADHILVINHSDEILSRIDTFLNSL